MLKILSSSIMLVCLVLGILSCNKANPVHPLETDATKSVHSDLILGAWTMQFSSQDREAQYAFQEPFEELKILDEPSFADPNKVSLIVETSSYDREAQV